MMIQWVGKMALPLLALTILSACQPAPYRGGYARSTYAAAPSCGAGQYAPPASCYQRPARYASPPPSCAPATYRSSRPVSNCAPVYRQRAYRYVAERHAPSCGPVQAGRYRPLRPDYLPYPSQRPTRYRPVRGYYR